MIPDVNKFLTIVIPTYNREKQLIRLLKSIERQNVIEKYYIVVLNNHSNYDVKTSIRNHFPDPFVENIEIYNRPYNAGGDYNIGSAFLFAKSQYLWIIGDDDEVEDSCIDIIEKNIGLYPDIPFFKYHIKGLARYNEDALIKNINDFTDLYNKNYFIAGDVLFVSNNIFNLSKLGGYISTALYYSYSSVSQVLPMLRCLIDEKPFMWCHSEIVKYNAPEGDHWNYIKIVTSLSTVLDINIGSNYSIVKSFFNILSDHFLITEFLQECLRISDKSYRKYVSRKGMNSLYEKKSFGIWSYYFFYIIESKTRIKTFTYCLIVIKYLRRNINRIYTFFYNSLICQVYPTNKKCKSAVRGKKCDI